MGFTWSWCLWVSLVEVGDAVGGVAQAGRREVLVVGIAPADPFDEVFETIPPDPAVKDGFYLIF